MNDHAILVHVELAGVSRLVGRLWARISRGRETASFEYARSWLSDPDSFALEPALPHGKGAFHTEAGRALFGALGDSAPDRWGRTLIARAARQRAVAQDRAPRALHELDYLLGVNDETRQGALRFALHEGGPFLAESRRDNVPPLIELPALLNAAAHVEGNGESHEELALLLAPGSSLGGARPKASVRMKNGTLAIAKFPSRGDPVDVVRWEMVALGLAKRAGIDVAPATLHTVDGRRVLIVERFDRQGNRRTPYLSAMSMLQAADGETRSYVEIADALRQHGAAAASDLPQLWRRLVFNVLISNTDDHLRNHGFLFESRNGWRLSPAFDMNPVPTDIKPRLLTTTIDANGDPTATVELAIEVARQFNLSFRVATGIVKEVSEAVATWRKEGAKHGLRASDLDRMASAFELAE